MKKLTNIIVLLCFATLVFAQSPKREFRATWLTTVWSIDWPSTKITSTGNVNQINAQKKQMRGMLDSLVSANMNAVCFQVRSRCDAMYNSSYEPWSTDLVSTRGMEPGYDPLAFVIEEGHKRGLEVHAWINPYRYESASGQWTGKAGDYRTTHPDWVLDHNGAAILNPGIPEVRQRISDVIEEIITNYDVDGVLFDDYFYLSGTNEDVDLYQANNPDNLSIGDWRRNNVNMMIAKVYSMIQNVKPYVRFGVSPAGIWDVNATIASSYGLTLPDVPGGYAYHGIYCDPVAWLSEGTVDYISPQVYWTIGSTHDYALLSPWWSETATHFGKQCYISHSLSAMSSNPVPAKAPMMLSKEDELGADARCEAGISKLEQRMMSINDAPATRFGYSEVANEIGINRNSDVNDAPGSVFFSHKNLRKQGFTTYLRNHAFNHKALTPAIHWKANLENPTIQTLTLTNRRLTWQCDVDNIKYGIYAMPSNIKRKLESYSNSTYFLGTSYYKHFDLPSDLVIEGYVFAVSIIDRYGNEYAPVVTSTSNEAISAPSLISPINNQEAIGAVIFKWNTIENALGYVLEVASESDFSNKVCAREVNGSQLSSEKLPPLVPGVQYYWRVRAKTFGNMSNYSETRPFSMLNFAVTAPSSNAQDVALMPTISWSKVADNVTYKLEIAKTSNFEAINIVYSTTTSVTNHEVPVDVLSALTKYYVRISTTHQGLELITNPLSFTTVNLIPEVPQITFPTNASEVIAKEINIAWTRREGVTGYRVELSTSDIFPRGRKIFNLPPSTLKCTVPSMNDDTYYVRVRANYNEKSGNNIHTAYTNWSDVVSFDYTFGTGIEDVNEDLLSAVIYQTKEEVLLHFSSPIEQYITAHLYTAQGVLIAKPLQSHHVVKETTLVLNSYLPEKGLYVLRLTNSLGEKTTLKFIKN